MIFTYYFQAVGSVGILGPFCGSWGGTQSTLEFTAVLTIPRAGRLRNLRILCLGGGVISNAPITFVARVNGVDTALLKLMPQASTQGTELAITVPVVAGDQLSIGMNSAGGNCPFLTQVCVDLDDNP